MVLLPGKEIDKSTFEESHFLLAALQCSLHTGARANSNYVAPFLLAPPQTPVTSATKPQAQMTTHYVLQFCPPYSAPSKLCPTLHFSSLARATMASTSVPGDPSATPDTLFLLLVPSVQYILRSLCIWYTQSAASSFSSNLQVSQILGYSSI